MLHHISGLFRSAAVRRVDVVPRCVDPSFFGPADAPAASLWNPDCCLHRPPGVRHSGDVAQSTPIGLSLLYHPIVNFEPFEGGLCHGSRSTDPFDPWLKVSFGIVLCLAKLAI